MRITGGATPNPVSQDVQAVTGQGPRSALGAALAGIVVDAVTHAAEIFGVAAPSLAQLPGRGDPNDAGARRNAGGDIVRTATIGLGAAIGIAPMRERDLYAALDRFAQEIGVLVNAAPHRMTDTVELVAAEIGRLAIERPGAEGVIAAIEGLSRRLRDQA